MGQYNNDNLSMMDTETLEKLHQVVDLELMVMLQYKHEIYLMLESKRPVVVPSADAHFMGAI